MIRNKRLKCQYDTPFQPFRLLDDVKSMGGMNFFFPAIKEVIRRSGGGQGYDNSVPGEVATTPPSGDRAAWFSTWSASLPQIQLISPGS